MARSTKGVAAANGPSARASRPFAVPVPPKTNSSRNALVRCHVQGTLHFLSLCVADTRHCFVYYRSTSQIATSNQRRQSLLQIHLSAVVHVSSNKTVKRRPIFNRNQSPMEIDTPSRQNRRKFLLFATRAPPMLQNLLSRVAPMHQSAMRTKARYSSKPKVARFAVVLGSMKFRITTTRRRIKLLKTCSSKLRDHRTRTT